MKTKTYKKKKIRPKKGKRSSQTECTPPGKQLIRSKSTSRCCEDSSEAGYTGVTLASILGLKLVGAMRSLE